MIDEGWWVNDRRPRIMPEELRQLARSLDPLRGKQFEVLKIPRQILTAFEPSQVGTIVGTLVDACLPYLAEILPDEESLRTVGLSKHAGSLGEREGYPDFGHTSGKRLELKGLYVDPSPDVQMKKPPTRREPSARITQKVTVKNVDPASDALLIVAYQLRPNRSMPDLFSPTVIDLGIFSMIECIEARDKRLASKGGRWFGNYETPVILSRIGAEKIRQSLVTDTTSYGRKESEGRDYNEDTNFGKLARIPYAPLRSFLQKYAAWVDLEI